MPNGRHLDRLSTLLTLRKPTMLVPKDVNVDVNAVLELQQRLSGVKITFGTETGAGVVPPFVF